MNVIQAMKDAEAKRAALDAYRKAHRRMDRFEMEARRRGDYEEIGRMHIYARAAGMAFVLEKSNPEPKHE